MKVKIDRRVGAAYITLVKRIRKGQVMWSHDCGDAGPNDAHILLDFDIKGRLLGIEIFSLSALHPSYSGVKSGRG